MAAWCVLAVAGVSAARSFAERLGMTARSDMKPGRDRRVSLALRIRLSNFGAVDHNETTSLMKDKQNRVQQSSAECVTMGRPIHRRRPRGCMALFLGGARGEMWWWWTGARRGDGGTTTGTVWSRGSVASRGMWAGARFDAGLLQLTQEASRAGSQAGPARRRQRLGSERICAMWPAWLIVSRARGGSSTLLRIHSLLASLHILLMAVDNVWHRRLDASGRRRVPRERRDLTMLCWQGSGRQSSEQANRRGSMPSEPSSPRQPQWFPTRGRHQRFCRLKLSGRWINSAEVVRGGGRTTEDSGGLAVAAAAATSTRPHACATMRTGGDGVDGNSQGEIGFARCRPWWRASRAPTVHFPAVHPPATGPPAETLVCIVETPADRGGHGERHALCLSGRPISHVVD